VVQPAHHTTPRSIRKEKTKEKIHTHTHKIIWTDDLATAAFFSIIVTIGVKGKPACFVTEIFEEIGWITYLPAGLCCCFYLFFLVTTMLHMYCEEFFLAETF